MKRLYFILLSMVINHFIYAQSPHIYVLHINGINTKQNDARDNFNHLQAAAQIQTNMVNFDFIWNPTGDDADKGFWSSLFDAVRQKSQEQKAIMSLTDFTNYYIKANHLPPYPESSPDFQKLRSQISTKYEEELKKAGGDNINVIIDGFHSKVPVEFASVLKLLGGQVTGNAIDYSKSPNYVLLLPHSQGNLYANSLYTYLTNIEHFDKQKLAIFSIATPANTNEGCWIADAWKKYYPDDTKIKKMFGNTTNYITSNEDYVIGGARILFNKYPDYIILPANVQLGMSGTDWSGHSLIDIYLTI